MDFSYTYDDIGNRLAAPRGAREWSYTPNALNQYAEIALPDDLAAPPEAPGLRRFSAVGWVGADANTVLTSSAYDFFGNPLVESSALHSFSGAWPLSATLSYTFSTKPHDPLTAHADYG